ncbi:MAG: tyrosine-type recombinase/integrase [Elusimicrobia bacterium]|nr:tyrosine-type recombinase/integrase [Elusimicrobiota bacterium]
MGNELAYAPHSVNKVPIGNASEAFMLRCHAQNLTDGTITWYTDLLRVWNRYLESNGVTLAKEVTPELIRSYFDDMRKRGMASGTIARTYGALRCFFGFLSRERMIPQNPFALIAKPRMEKKLIKPLSMEQARLLLAAINKRTFQGLRLWTMVVLMLDTGLRVAEVMGLRVDEMDFQAGVLRVMGKGAKERQVPFSSVAKQALWNYTVRRGEIPGQDLVFVSQFGKRLERCWMRKALRCVNQRLKLQGVRLSPHTLRHTFATQYIINGGDAFSLQEILGHSTINMVRLYVALANRDVALMHRRFSPMERMGVVPGSRRRIMVRGGLA